MMANTLDNLMHMRINKTYNLAGKNPDWERNQIKTDSECGCIRDKKM